VASLADIIDGLVIGVHLFSVHSEAGLNGRNPGIFVRAPSGFTAGVYENSVSGTLFAGNGSPRRISAYAGWTFETDSQRFALTIGGATGYGRDAQVVCLESTVFGCEKQQRLNSIPSVVPFVVPSVRIPFGESSAARIGYVYTPPIGAKAQPVHAAHLMLEHRF
jgi:hypothetical protein